MNDGGDWDRRGLEMNRCWLQRLDIAFGVVVRSGLIEANAAFKRTRLYSCRHLAMGKRVSDPLQNRCGEDNTSVKARIVMSVIQAS